MSSDPRTGVLFVCLGNICRSPLAEGIFLHYAANAGVTDRFRVDSAGTAGYHTGSCPDPRSIAVASRHGIVLPSIARPVSADEVQNWDAVIAMDRQNQRELLKLGFARGVVSLMRDEDPDAESPDVPDPYYGGDDGFDRVYEMLDRACSRLLDRLRHNTR